MTALDANADGNPQPEVQTEEVVVAEVAVTGPLAGNPAILGLPTFIAGSVALGLGLAGVVPAGPVSYTHLTLPTICSV